MIQDTIKTTIVETTDNNGDPETVISTSTFRMSYDNDILTVSRVTVAKNEDGEDEEVVTPMMIQPWKCLPDGTNAKFSDAEDAFQWFEQDIKPTIN